MRWVKHQDGFSLVELLVVISIVGVLSTIGLTSYQGTISKTKEIQKKADVDALAKVFETKYNFATGIYPSPPPITTSDFTSGRIPDGTIFLSTDRKSFKACLNLTSPANTSSCNDSNPPPSSCYCKDSAFGSVVAQLQDVITGGNPLPKTTAGSSPESTPSNNSTPVPTPASTLSPALASACINSGLVGYWKMDETTGSTLNDSSALENNAIATGTTIVDERDGKAGKARAFNGTSDYINLQNSETLKLDSGTISLWMKTSGAGANYRAIIAKNNAFGLFLKDNILITYDEKAGLDRSTDVNLADGNWHHIALTFQNNVTNGTNIYIDSIKATNTTVGMNNQNYPLLIGNNSGTNQYFNGIIDDVRIYNTVLDENWVKSLLTCEPTDPVTLNPTVNVTVGCISKHTGEGVTVSWTNPSNPSVPVYRVDMSDASGFNAFYTKNVTGTSTKAPSGFTQYPAQTDILTLYPNTSYYVKLYNSIDDSNVKSFSIPPCATPTPTPTPVPVFTPQISTSLTCINNGYTGNGVTISWVNPDKPVTFIDISTDATFPENNFYNQELTSTFFKPLPTSITVPDGFGKAYTGTPALTLNPNTPYYVRLFNNNTADGINGHSTNASFNIPACTSTPSPSGATPTPTSAPTSARDPLKWPFASDSIWNMPIGSNANYVPANLNPNPRGETAPGLPTVDEEVIILKPDAPLTNVYYSSAGFTGENRCVKNEPEVLKARVNMPSNYLIPNSGKNSAAVFLKSDNRTVQYGQPLARCTAGGYATAQWISTIDIYGDGRPGAHGGSGLSSLGGSIRLGELRPGQVGMKHALKVDVDAAEALYNCNDRKGTKTPGNTDDDCFRWPAYWADGYAESAYGSLNNNQNKAMKMGALLAIPSSTDINSLGLETEPAKQLAWTLQNYGAYIVDDIFGPTFAFNVEVGADGSKLAEFESDWDFKFGPYRDWENTSWQKDIQRLMRALYVVDNNSPDNIGGGGTPSQPLAPAIGQVAGINTVLNQIGFQKIFQEIVSFLTSKLQ